MVFYINPRYTSQRCNKCEYIEKANRRSQSIFRCLRCNYRANTDFNASKNILVDEQAVLAYGVTVLADTKKQELKMRKLITV